MTRAFFITGTDTAVGKTMVACHMLRLARADGLSTLGLKPVAAGCDLVDGLWMNDDARALMQNSSINPEYATVNPACLPEPMAPHIAAMRAGVSLDAGALSEHCRLWMRKADFTVIEGAGGWQVPINRTETMATLATSLGCPVILVVGIRLGCINHALLSAAAIHDSGLRLAGWIANRMAPDMAAADENVAALEERLDTRLLGDIPFLPGDQSAAAAHLSLA